MEAPLGLNDSLRAVVEKATDGHALFETMIELREDQWIDFFDCAADDATWFEEKGGDQFMRNMVPYLNQVALHHKIAPKTMEIGAKAIRRNLKSILPFLPEDVDFLVQLEKIKVNSLLYKVFGGEYFSDLIDQYLVTRNIHEIPLEGVSKKVFRYLKEFIYTDKMENLWKEEPKVILALQKRGSKWGLKDLSEQAFRTYKNYISEEVLFKRVVVAFESRNVHLTQELLDILSSKDFGFTLKLTPSSGFELKVSKLNNEQENLLSPLLKSVSVLICDGSELDEMPFKKLLNECIHLEEVDLSALRSVSDGQDLVKALPRSLRNFTLKEASWVNDSVIETIISHFPALRTLDLEGCENYRLSLLSELSSLKELETLSLAGNSQVSYDQLKIILPLLSHLQKLDLSRCNHLTDPCLILIASELKDIKELYIAHCLKLTSDGIMILSDVKTLKALDIRNIPGIPPNFKERHQRRFWMLKTFLV